MDATKRIEQVQMLAEIVDEKAFKLKTDLGERDYDKLGRIISLLQAAITEIRSI